MIPKWDRDVATIIIVEELSQQDQQGPKDRSLRAEEPKRKWSFGEEQLASSTPAGSLWEQNGFRYFNVMSCILLFLTFSLGKGVAMKCSGCTCTLQGGEKNFFQNFFSGVIYK